MKTALEKPRATPKRNARRTDPESWAQAVDRFMTSLEHEERSQYTTGHYRADIASFEAWWERENPDEPLLPVTVTGEDLRDWKRHLKAETLRRSGSSRMPATVNAKLAAVKSFLGWCHRKKVIQVLPDFPPADKLGTRAVKWLEKREQRQLLRSLARDSDKRAHPIGIAILETGLRLSEFVALRRKDVVISERKGLADVREGKGRKPRTVPLNKAARRAFEALFALVPDGGPDDPITLSRRTNSDTGRRDALSGRALQDILARHGVHPHALRHTFGMNLMKAGVPMPAIAALMGHTSILTTMTHYATPSQSDLEAAVNHGDD